MIRSEEIALAHVTGPTPAFTVDEIVKALLNRADDDIAADEANKFRQGAELLHNTMTPKEIDAELQAIAANVPGAFSTSLHINSYSKTARAYISLPNNKYIEGEGDSFREAIDSLRAAVAATDVDAGITERVAQALLTDAPMPNDIKPEHLARVIDRARIRAREMAAAFLSDKQAAE
ncbi:hypothetical protein [Telmatospirillum sp.]|uniref:hypothetical protein n=1 Tax=Telmatospirillum sp. TaxID=2079197 RepID=UPI00283F0EED|nr:hypothetical protein [Telmatospirillum sp.]MDR3439854.1 hypothetical protein [Telmatospirillum sp.]